jgi:hypothetical protein
MATTQAVDIVLRPNGSNDIVLRPNGSKGFVLLNAGLLKEIRAGYTGVVVSMSIMNGYLLHQRLLFTLL